MADFKEKRLLDCLEKAKNGDMEALENAFFFNENFFVHSTVNGELHIKIINSESEFPGFSIPLKTIYEYDQNFYKEFLGLSEKDLEIPKPEDNAPVVNNPVMGAISDKSVSEIKDMICSLEKGLKAEIDELKKGIVSANREQKESVEHLKGEIKTISEAQSAGAVNSKELDALQNKIDAMAKKASEYESEISRLTTLAFTDTKFGVANNNALNGTLKTLAKGTFVGKVSICGLKTVNDSYGLKSGDALIQQVVTSLTARFDKNVIYRVNGDMFFVIPTDIKNENSFYEKLTATREELQAKQIKIVFGLLAFEGPQTFALLDDAIKKAKAVKVTRDWNANEGEKTSQAWSDDTSADTLEDDGFRMEDSAALLRNYQKR